MPAEPDVRVLADPQAIFAAAANEFGRLAKAAVGASGRFTVALAGGSTPRSLYSLLASGAEPGIPWGKILFFFADERHVPPDHPESNFRMAHESMLKVSVPKQNIFRVPAEIPDADTAAQSYEQTLREAFKLEEGELPRFDLILLGMGPDGHTASLFPQTAALHEEDRLVAANWVEKFKSWRITFTYPVLNHAAEIIFMVTGTEKQNALRHVLRGKPDAENYPAQAVRPEQGNLIWLVDKAAAGKLK